MWISEERVDWPFLNAIQSAGCTITGNLATWSEITVANEAGAEYTDPYLRLSADGTRVIAVSTSSLPDWSSSVQSASATITGSSATWSSPEDISPVGNGFSPKVALSKNGAIATAIWNLNGSGGLVVQSSTASIVNGIAGWASVPTTLSTEGGFSFLPRIAMSAESTTAVAVWSAFAGNDSFVRSALARFSPAEVTDAPVKGFGHWKNSTQTQSQLPLPLGSYLVSNQLIAASVFDATNCGKKGANAIGWLAGHLLTTKLNIAAGANASCITASVMAGDALLNALNYSGPTTYQLTNPERSTAISLAGALNSYNSNGCA
jgi:hypothetical protein